MDPEMKENPKELLWPLEDLWGRLHPDFPHPLPLRRPRGALAFPDDGEKESRTLAPMNTFLGKQSQIRKFIPDP